LGVQRGGRGPRGRRLADLRLAIDGYRARTERCARRYVERGREKLVACARLLPSRDRLLGPQRQRVDDAGVRADRALERRVALARRALDRHAGVLRPAMLERQLAAARARLEDLGRVLKAVNPDAMLDRGFVRVTARDGRTLTSAEAARSAGALTLRFRDGAVDAKVEKAGARTHSSAKPEQPTFL
jgi:exodeoxyribonuclease VII large subunit